MKISQTLPQFNISKTLFIVSGARLARFLVAYRGEITEPKGFRVEERRYSDREGYFEHRGSGEVYGASSTYEAKSDVMTKQFEKELVGKTKEIMKSNNPESIVLFAPKHLKDVICESFPKDIQTKIVAVVPGNFTHDKHLDLIGRIPRNITAQLSKARS